MVGGNTRADDDLMNVGETLDRLGCRHQSHTVGNGLRKSFVVGEKHALAEASEQPRGGKSAGFRTNDQASRAQWPCPQRKRSVARATSAHSTETIQNRTMISGSGHPESSK